MPEGPATFWSAVHSRLSRVTSSGAFIPEVDGLRFIAIGSVVLYHIHAYCLQHGAVVPSSTWFSRLFINGQRGVQLFFVISGFILGLPFASHYLKGTPKIKVKSYFLRRLTRRSRHTF